MRSKTDPLAERERNKQRYWSSEVASIIRRARALVKYRGQSHDQMFLLKMELANALAEYDSRPNML